MQCLPKIDLFTENMSLNYDKLSQVFIFISIVHFDTVTPLLQISHCVTGDVADSRGNKGTCRREIFIGCQLLLEKRWMVLIVVNNKNKHHPQ